MKKLFLGYFAVLIVLGLGFFALYNSRNHLRPVNIVAQFKSVTVKYQPEGIDYSVNHGLVVGAYLITGNNKGVNGTWSENRWMVQDGTLKWNSHYKLVLLVKGGIPYKTRRIIYNWSTGNPPFTYDKNEIVTINPANGQQVGMAATFQISFSQPLSASAETAIVKQLVAKETIADPIGWHWWSNTQLDGRPERFWPLGETVNLTINLNDIINNNQLLKGSLSSSFSVNEQHLILISAKTDEMKVYNGSQLLHVFPVSLGRAGFPTISGTLTVLYKEPVVFMNSATIGYPGIYAENVYYDVAISTDGYYMHSAPWDVYDHGYYNVSFGCVEQNPNNAIWVYNWSEPGDAVIISGTTLMANESDGEGDWNLPWNNTNWITNYTVS